MLIGLKKLKGIFAKVKPKKSLFLLPHAFTFLNAIFGFISILKSINYEYSAAAFYIILAAILDACDGRLARAIGSSSYFGMELDSLSDAISFCLAPTILLYTWFDQNSYLSTLVLIFYFCAGLARLAKFNLQNAIIGTSNNTSKEFIGMPTTMAAFFISSLILHNNWFCNHSLQILLGKYFLIPASSMIAVLMISPFKFNSFKLYKIKTRDLPMILFVLLILVWAIVHNYPILLLGISFYIFWSILCNIFNFLKTY